MAIILPATPGIRNATPRLLDWGGRLVPILGGPVQTLLRLGTRFALEFTLPPVRSEPEGRIWVGKLNEAKLAGGRIAFIQDGFDVGIPGAPVVNGNGHTGMLLPIRGGSPGYAFRYGQFVTLVHGGKRYLEMVTADVVLDGNGNGTLPILPMLRVIPSDGDPIEVAAPTIEGSLIGDERAWKVTEDPFLDLGPIRIDEDE